MTPFDRIKKLARVHGLSFIEVNDKAGLGTRTIYHWKKQVPKSDSLTAVAKILHTSADYLLGNTDDPLLFLSSVHMQLILRTMNYYLIETDLFLMIILIF